MNNSNDTYEREGAALSTTESTPEPSMTISDYLYSVVNFDIPTEVVVRILLERDVDASDDAMDVPKSVRDLCKADLYVWIVMGASRRGTVSDTDNGWTHSDGGYTLTEQDKRYFLNAANAIYESNGEPVIGKVKAKIVSSGIQRAHFTLDDTPLPHVIL